MNDASDMETFKQIMHNTGRRRSECQCGRCKDQCRTPCLGTPGDILRLIDKGYAGKLAISCWMVGMAVGKLSIPIPMVQARRTENGCIFFRDGLCELHDLGLKPTEGKLSHHVPKPENFIFEFSLVWNVAREWIRPANLEKILKVFVIMSDRN
ncbi:MAG: hypothetical protein LBV74_13115 [Tannerella sp.]|jgi:hypothetical protein|nr:hypothetical protein [Tannerella sp.]